MITKTTLPGPGSEQSRHVGTGSLNEAIKLLARAYRAAVETERACKVRIIIIIVTNINGL